MFPAMTPAQVFTRSLAMTYNPNRRRPKSAASATPSVVDAQQAQRDVWFAELIERCRTERVRPTTIALCLEECGRSQSDLDSALDAIEAEKIASDAVREMMTPKITPTVVPAAPAATPMQPTTSPAATAKPVSVGKETKMSEHEKQKVKSEWNTKMQAMADVHPLWSTAAVLSQVARENPDLRERYVAAANSR